MWRFRTKDLVRIGVSCVAGAGLTALLSATAAADPVGDFYKGKHLTLIVSTGPGGGFDLYSRTLSAHLGRHIPGHPTIVLQFMPGAGGVTAANHVYTVSPRDGTVFALPYQTVALYQRLYPSGVRYDAAKFNWIGRMASAGQAMVVWHSAPATTLQQMKKTEVIFAATGKSQDTYYYPRMMATLLGYKVRIVLGYQAAAEAMNALERGEVHGYTSSWAALVSTKGAWMKEGKLIPVVNASLEKRGDYPDVPLMASLTEDPSKKAIIEFFLSAAAVGRSFALPPGTPRDRVAALRRAFTETMSDPAFLADVKKRRMDLEPLSGEQVQAIIEKAVATPASLVTAAAKAVN
jgi:tripartite-type tricarboxylate transporter receptor subunit TctC